METETPHTFAARYGLEALNSLTKYPSILTLHTLGERGRLTEKLTTPLCAPLYATEKIDGTNVRLLLLPGGGYFIGSRENLLTAAGDLLFDPAQGIVAGLRAADGPAHAATAAAQVFPQAALVVVYGEFYGGRTSANAKQYGSETTGFRVFDAAVFSEETLAVAARPVREIAQWRETETPDGLRYGQPFLGRARLEQFCSVAGLAPVPVVSTVTNAAALAELVASPAATQQWLREVLPETQVGLSATAGGQPEGVVLRSATREQIVKVRFEDYARTLRAR